MSEKQIPEPRPAPQFRGSVLDYVNDLTRYLEEHLREVHQELTLLHETKADT